MLKPMLKMHGKTYFILTTLVPLIVSCQPPGPPPKKENGSNGIKRQSVLPKILVTPGSSPFSLITFVPVTNLPRVLPAALSNMP